MLETASLADKDHWIELVRNLIERDNNLWHVDEREDEVDDYIWKQREVNQILVLEIRRRHKVVESAKASL